MGGWLQFAMRAADAHRRDGRTDMEGRADADMGICFAKADGRLSKEKSIFRSVCLATRLDSSARANFDDVMSASLLRSSPVEVFDAP